jgi:hypothetical protein
MEPLEYEETKLALRRDFARAQRRARRGLVMVAAVPISVAIAVLLGVWFDTFAPLVAAAFYSTFGGPAGVVIGIYNGVRSRRLTMALAELEQLQLPPARLLRRPTS